MKTLITSLLILMGIMVYSQDPLPKITYLDSIYLYVHPENNAIDIEWGGYGIDITAGNGAEDQYCGIENTAAIVEQLGDNGSIPYPAKVCDTLESYGFTDWYLPAKYELFNICLNKDSLGLSWIGNGTYTYWTSNENNEYMAARTIIPNFCETASTAKNQLYNCRCIRRESISTTAKPDGNTNEPEFYHNLEDGNLNISIKGLTGEFKLSVYNIQGQKIETREIKCTGEGYSGYIDVSGYPKGTYIIELLNGQMKKTVKFVI